MFIVKAKKITGIVLCLCILLYTFSFNISANSASGSLQNMLPSARLAASDNNDLPDADIKLAVNTSTYKFYDNLTGAQKAIYNAFVNTSGGLKASPKGQITVNFSSSQAFSISRLSANIAAAAAALTDDLPEYFWIYPLPFDYTYTTSGLFSTTVTSLTLTLNCDYLPYSSIAQIEREYNAMLKVVRDFPVYGDTDYEKISSIHNGLCRLASYSTDITANTSPVNSKVFFPSSALLAPYSTVCDGYSKAFKMLCDENNIPCIIVVGYAGNVGHAWNYVKMGGRWYAIDSTWDDLDGSSNICSDEFFMMGSGTSDTYGRAFSATHTATGDRYTNVTLVYPDLSASAYTPTSADISLFGDANTDGKVSLMDAKRVLQSVADSRPLICAGKLAADINRDGSVGIADAKQILIQIASSAV